MANVLVVTGNSSPTTGDQEIIDRLSDQLGHDVDTRIDDDPAEGTSAYDLVIFAESSSSGEVNKYSGISVPAMVCEGASWASFGLTVSYHTDTTDEWDLLSQSVIDHGLGTGDVQVFTSSVSQHYARRSDELPHSPTVVATVGDDSDRATVIVVDEGGDLVSGTSPARRAAYGLHNSGAENSTSDQWAVFDAVVTWLLGGEDDESSEDDESPGQPEGTLRFYFGESDATVDPDEPSLSMWNDEASGFPVARLSPTPNGLFRASSGSEASTDNTWDVMLGRWITGPAQSSGYIRGNEPWTFTAAAWADEANAELSWAIAAWVMDDEGDRKETLFQSVFSNPWVQAANAAGAVAYECVNTNVPTSDVAIDEGDRIVVELGFRARNTTSSERTGTLVYGGTAWPPLETGDTGADVASKPSWIDIPVSDGLTFEDEGQQHAIIVQSSIGFTDTEETSHEVELPSGILAGDQLLVLVAQEDSNATGPENISSGWDLLATRAQRTSTNVRGDVFWCQNSLAGGTPLTFDLPAAQKISYVVYHLRAADEPAIASDDAGDSNGGIVEFSEVSGLPLGDYLHILAVAVDYNKNPGPELELSDPNGTYLDNYYMGPDNTAIPSLVGHAAMLCADVIKRNVTGINPPDLQYTSNGITEQWVSFNILVPAGTWTPPELEGDPPVANAGSDAQVVSGDVFERAGTYDANGGTNVVTSWSIVDGPADVGASATGNTVSYEPIVLGQYTLRFTVTTEFGEDSDDLVLTVVDAGDPPGQVFDLKSWHLTTPADSGDGDAEQIDQPELDTYSSEFLFLDAEDRMVCVAPTDGFTTSGASGATRTEFREHEPFDAGYANAAWSVFDNRARSLTVTGMFDPTSITGGSNPRKEMIIGQIHGEQNEPVLYLAAEYHVATPRIRVFKYNGSSTPGVDNMLAGVTPSTLITYRIEYDPGENPAGGTGRVRVYGAFGEADQLDLQNPDFQFEPADFFDQTTDWYFKFGSYNKTSIGDAESGYAISRITFAELLVDDIPVFTTRFFLAG